jgi:hypothetical protein
MVTALDRFERLSRDTRLIGEMLVSPIVTLRRLGNRRPLLGPWLTVAVASVMLTLTSLSVAQRTVAHGLRDTGSSDTVQRVEGELNRLKTLAIGVAPLGLIARWAGIAVSMWALAVLLGADLRVRTAGTIVALSSGPEVLSRGADVAVAWFVGPELRPDLTPVLGSATSLGALLPEVGGTGWGAAALEAITPFVLWTGVLWVAGLRQMGRLRPGQALAVAVPPWLAGRVGSAALRVLQESLTSAVGAPIS